MLINVGIEGRFCGPVPLLDPNLVCCLPCPFTEWIYPACTCQLLYALWTEPLLTLSSFPNMVLTGWIIQCGRPRHLCLPSRNMGCAAAGKDTPPLPQYMSRRWNLADGTGICDSARNQTAAMLQWNHAEWHVHKPDLRILRNVPHCWWSRSCHLDLHPSSFNAFANLLGLDSWREVLLCISWLRLGRGRRLIHPHDGLYWCFVQVWQHLSCELYKLLQVFLGTAVRNCVARGSNTTPDVGRMSAIVVSRTDKTQVPLLHQSVLAKHAQRRCNRNHQ